ncbi:MAG: type II toxin-antitoxin system MqsA family antitoxin [Burkholderiaceae bacterium]|nr:type II toxin-antitoxin system MqsA family antitoxin [Burkholderiaceae bacterium]MEB2351269.1 type II toxin-antitoxin system MqsA family antitoxin [Burkholderiaceae bacterium]
MSKQCGVCGARQMAPFENEAFEIEHRGRKTTVEGLGGLRCRACGEVLFDAESAQRYGAASDELVLAARADEGEAIKRIRLRLGLTQSQASFLTGGGPNAFSRYETGKAQPMAAVTNLLALLDAHPDLLQELRVPPAPGRRIAAKPGTKKAAAGSRAAARA